MSLTNVQIEDLAKKMNIPLVFCDFKDMLLTKTHKLINTTLSIWRTNSMRKVRKIPEVIGLA